MKRVMNGLDLQLQRIQNVGDGVSPTDVPSLQQMQAFVRGLAWKSPARAGSTGNVPLTAPGASIDGVALAANDVVLLKNQTAGAENGLYVWTSATATLTRTLDANSASLLRGAAVSVTEGTSNADKVFTQNADSITLGTTVLTWVQLGGAAASYLAGSGLSLNGQTFAVVAGAGIIADATSTRIDPSVVPRKFAMAVPSSTTPVITHNLGTRDVGVTVYDTATFQEVDADPTHTDVNTVTLGFGVAPAAGAFRVVVTG